MWLIEPMPVFTSSATSARAAPSATQPAATKEIAFVIRNPFMDMNLVCIGYSTQFPLVWQTQEWYTVHLPRRQKT